MLSGCDWVMKKGWLWARVARAGGGRTRVLVLKIFLIVLAHVALVSIVLLIAKRTSLLLDGSRLAQCRDGLTKTIRVITPCLFGDTGGVSEVEAAQPST